MKLVFVLPFAALSELGSSRKVYPLPAEQDESTAIHAAKTKSPELEVVSPLIVATRPEAGVVLYWGVPSIVAMLPV
jgi:hypothetical protein